MSAASRTYLAVDLGASSGRVVAGRFDGTRLTMEEVHRFPNSGVRAAGRLQWDVLALWEHIKTGLKKAAASNREIASVAVDTWGVDFALLGRHDELLSNPYCYRDQRTDGVLAQAFAEVPREEIFVETGLQFMPFNSLYQLFAMRRDQSPLLEMAETFLMMPDLFHWLLTGVKSNEFTNASTTQFLNPQTGQWATGLLERFGLPTEMLQPLMKPGTVLGTLAAEVAEETGLRQTTRVTLPGTHDTASAVMSVPAPPDSRNWCYLSSGTWSLLGAEVESPVVTAACLQRNFTNEGGVGNTIRLLKNIGGLWLVQECRRIWAKQGREYNWDQLVALARQAPALTAIVNPDDPSLLAPADMPQALRDYCRASGQPEPESDGAVIRCALESLAVRYRVVLNGLEELLGHTVDTMCIVGGGALNQLLCQMAADACQCRVLAGPVEATAIGNVMMQSVAAGDVADIGQARQVVRDSYDVQTYQPGEAAPWEDAVARGQ